MSSSATRRWPLSQLRIAIKVYNTAHDCAWQCLTKSFGMRCTFVTIYRSSRVGAMHLFLTMIKHTCNKDESISTKKTHTHVTKFLGSRSIPSTFAYWFWQIFSYELNPDMLDVMGTNCHWAYSSTTLLTIPSMRWRTLFPPVNIHRILDTIRIHVWYTSDHHHHNPQWHSFYMQ